jgi:hypothetical protein
VHIIPLTFEKNAFFFAHGVAVKLKEYRLFRNLSAL